MNDQAPKEVPSTRTMIRRAAQTSREMTPAERWAVYQASEQNAQRVEADLDVRERPERVG